MVEMARGLVARSWRGLTFLTAIVCLPLHAATLNVPGTFATIQAAINAANPAGGDTIQVAAGTYTEQLVISKNLSLIGAGSATTIVQAPASMVTDPIIGAPSIVVINSGTASISGFTVQGPGSGCSDVNFGVGFGVGVYGGATLTFDGNHVTRIRDNPITGDQCGTAIRAGFGAQVGHLIVSNTLVDDYQKNGIYVFGAGSTGTISNTIVTGDGPETIIAQNGIIISGGATATLTGNTVSGNDCDDTAAGCGPNPVTDVQSGGIIIVNATATMSNNSVNNNDAGILAFNSTTGVGPSTSSQDTFSSNRYENIFVESATLSLQADTVGGTSNFAIYALSSPGDVANSTVLVDCLSSITGPQQVTNDNGSLTTASIVLASCAPTIAKAFGAPSILANGTTTLTFTLTSPTPNNLAQTVSFSDNLPTKLQVAAVPNVGGTCTGGTVTAAAGASTITVTNRVVPASGAAAATCTITVDVTNVPLQVGTCPDANLTNGPANLTGLVNVTNAVTPSCVTVTPQTPSVNKAFSPTTIAAGGTTTLLFTISNPVANNPAQVVSFVDTLPTKLQLAAIPNVRTTCTGGTITAAAGSNTITVAGATVAASGTSAATICTIAVDVTNVPLQSGTCPDANLTNGPANVTGLVNVTNAVTPSCVTVTQQTPSVNKAFSPTTIAAGGTTTLTFTLTNPAVNNPAQVVSFVDTLPTKLQVAAVPNVVSTCTGGTITAAAGSSSITVAGPTVPASTAAASTCTISVAVTNVPLQAGTCPDANLTNTSANLSGLVNVTNAVAPSCVTVTQQQPSLNKAFSPTTINLGGTTTLTFTLTNPAPNNAAQTVSFIDTLPTKLQVAAVPNLGGTCSGGTVTAVAGASTITVTGRVVPASTAAASSCTVTVDVTNVPNQVGTCPDANLTNTSANISGLANLTNAVTPSCVTVNGLTFAISKVASASSVPPNTAITFTISVTNNGPGAANGSVLTDPAIAGFTASAITCTNSSGGATCPAGVTLANLQGAGITLTTFPAGGTLTFNLAGTFTLATGSVTNTTTVSPPPGIPLPPQSASATVSAFIPVAGPIPTLSEYALLALMLLLAGAGATYSRRRLRR